MTYAESALLMTNLDFKGRVKVSALKFAGSIMIELTTVPAHNTRLRWAQSCYQQPDMVAGQLQSPVVMDPAVQLAGADITDPALQGAVEGVINNMM